MIPPSVDRTAGRLVGGLVVMLVLGGESSTITMLPTTLDAGYLVACIVLLVIRKMKSTPPHKQ
jgi:hypothetical protein